MSLLRGHGPNDRLALHLHAKLLKQAQCRYPFGQRPPLVALEVLQRWVEVASDLAVVAELGASLKKPLLALLFRFLGDGRQKNVRMDYRALNTN